MPKIETWSRLLPAIRNHLVDRMHDRNISIDDLNQLRLWMDSKPSVPEGMWFKDFGSSQTLWRRQVSKDVCARGPKRKRATS